MKEINHQSMQNEVDLKVLFLNLWHRKILIIVTTIITTICAILFSLSLPDIYQSNALLTPTGQDESLSSKLGGYSSIAGLAGIGLPGSSGKKDAEAVERIKSYDFFTTYFLPNIKLEDLFASEDWEQRTNSIIYDKTLFDKKSRKWIRDASFPKKSKPSNQEAYEVYLDILRISLDQQTRYVKINIRHHSPYIAKEWLELIIKNINSYMKEIDKKQAENSVNFLQNSYQKTNFSEVKIAMTKLLESQIQTLMLTEATDDYIFKRIVSPVASENKSEPSRVIIILLGSILGFIIGAMICLYLNYMEPKKLSKLI